jgi:hypothetical protein
MGAVLRLGTAILAAALALAPIAAPAQEANQAASPPSTTSTVGPQDLQNFDLQGRVTRPAEQPPASQPPPSPKPRAQAPTATNVVQSVSKPAEERATTPRQRGEPAPERATAPEPLRQTAPASSVTVSLPRLDKDTGRSSAAAPVPVATAGLDSPATVPPEHKLSILPWLLAAFALGAAAAFLLLRNRRREAFAGGPQLDLFAAPEAEPQPAPAPRAQPAPPPQRAAEPAPVPPPTRPEPAISGLVSTRLRPWLEIGFDPVNCIVDDRQVTFEFEVELLNSGNAPARAVLVEASLFNASNNQDQELEAFFANPLAEGERIPVIQPLKRIRLKSKVVTDREHVQVYEIGRRKVFVPIIAFNALYRWRGSEGQTSASFLLGIDTKAEKMAPFRLDLGPRQFAVTARQLPSGQRK